MEHFNGSTAEERYKNDMLSELIKIRELLERNAQVVEQSKGDARLGKDTVVEQTNKEVRGRKSR